MKSTRVAEDADGPNSPPPESVQCFPTLFMLPDPPPRSSVVVLCISRHVVGLHDVAIVDDLKNLEIQTLAILTQFCAQA